MSSLQQSKGKAEGVQAFFALVLDLLFPRTCPFCGEVLPFSTPWEREQAQRLFWVKAIASKAPSKMTPLGSAPSEAAADAPLPECMGKKLSHFYVCPICEKKLPYLLKDSVWQVQEAETIWSKPLGTASPLWLRPVCAKCGRPLSKLHASAKPQAESTSQAESKPLAGYDAADGGAEERGKLENGKRESEALLCSGCRQHVRLFQRCICLFPYEDQLRKLLAGVKYRHERQAMEALGELSALRFGPLLLALHPDALVPVPVHRKRLRERGYNQAAVFCRVLSERTGIPMAEELLRREKNTKAQKELGAAGRMKNLQNAFWPGVYPRGQKLPKRVLLVDDIYTTGATLEACTETLFEAGVKEVFGLCICGAAEQAG